MRLIVNAQTGQIVQQANYSSFGETTFKSGDFISLGFAGGIIDEDTNLIRFGARDFDPQTGRWTTKDPIKFQGGNFNLYNYSYNDPVNLIDTNGNFVVCNRLSFTNGNARYSCTVSNANPSLSNPSGSTKTYVVGNICPEGTILFCTMSNSIFQFKTGIDVSTGGSGGYCPST
mgnify:FL=1